MGATQGARRVTNAEPPVAVGPTPAELKRIAEEHRRDSERLWWLVKNQARVSCVFGTCGAPDTYFVFKDVTGRKGWWGSGSTYREAIDNARKQTLDSTRG